jgi:nucleoside 2-deoxyribosyltransferase
MTIDVVGGVYYEYCARPRWDSLYGSGGRAAVGLAKMGGQVRLRSYFTPASSAQFRADFALLSKLTLAESAVAKEIRFRYMHDSSKPEIFRQPDARGADISVVADNVVRFGMLEGEAIVEADWAVYDPQNMGVAEPFAKNGSKANHLALVLNSYEAQAMANAWGRPPNECAQIIAGQQNAEVVVVKMGAAGALVWTAGKAQTVPAYRTTNVWKIGSGDCFVAYFAHAWMHERRSPQEAAAFASRATAYYCETTQMPTPADLATFNPAQVQVSEAFKGGAKRQVYLAGPFFDLAQLWMIEEARRNLREAGLKVFSPYHDIGLGRAVDVVEQDLKGIRQSDIVFAIADGLDAGTIYEIGYARAIGRPVVVYSEREGEEALKMAEGSGCVIVRNYTTALYAALWEAAKL